MVTFATPVTMPCIVLNRHCEIADFIEPEEGDMEKRKRQTQKTKNI